MSKKNSKQDSPSKTPTKKAGVGVENHFTYEAVCACDSGLRDAVFCASCGDIQPVSFNSPFFLFDCLETYFLDTDSLRQKYLRLQNKLHPDRFLHHAPETKKQAEQHASYLNWAYDLLKDAFKRAEYLLKEVPDSFSSEALANQMARQEKLEALSDKEALEAYQDQIQQEKCQASKEMATAFGNHDAVQAKEHFLKIRYLRRLEDNLTKKLNKV